MWTRPGIRSRTWHNGVETRMSFSASPRNSGSGSDSITDMQRRLIGTIATLLLLGGMIPATAGALQLGGAIGFHPGPADWDQLDTRDPLLDGAIGVHYQTPCIRGLQPELLGDFG